MFLLFCEIFQTLEDFASRIPFHGQEELTEQLSNISMQLYNAWSRKSRDYKEWQIPIITGAAGGENHFLYI